MHNVVDHKKAKKECMDACAIPTTNNTRAPMLDEESTFHTIVINFYILVSEITLLVSSILAMGQVPIS